MRHRLAPGFLIALEAMRERAAVHFVTTSRNGNSADSVSRDLEDAGVPDPFPVSVISDAARASYLRDMRVRVYFDDKPDLLREVREHGIVAVHINNPLLTIRTPDAHWFFESWASACKQFDAVFESS
jgi:hypothetical protein